MESLRDAAAEAKGRNGFALAAPGNGASGEPVPTGSVSKKRKASELRSTAAPKRVQTAPGRRKVTSKYTGVSYHGNRGKWQVKIRSNGKQKHLGYFEDEVEAARAYNRAARVVHAKPKLNQVPDMGQGVSADHAQSVDARIQDMTRQVDANRGRGRTKSKRGRSRSPRSRGAARAAGVHSSSGAAPSLAGINRREFSSTLSPLLIARAAALIQANPAAAEVKIHTPQTTMLPPKPAALVMENTSKQVDTPTLFEGTATYVPSPRGVTTKPAISFAPAGRKTATHKRRKKTSMRMRAGPLASLKVDIKNKVVTSMRHDGMLKLTPLNAEAVPGGRLLKNLATLESPTNRSTAGSAPRSSSSADGPGDLFPQFSPGYNTYSS